MKKFTFFLLMLFLIGINFSIKAQSYVPLGISTGWNGDLIANGPSTSAAATTSGGFDNGGMVYYSTDFTSSTNGSPPCPNSGIPASITSPNGPVYNIASFVNQTLILNPSGGSGTLVFSNSGSFDHLSVLAASANSPSNTATLNVQVNFSSGSPYTTTFIVGDWFSGTSNIAKSGLGRVNRTGDIWDQCGSFKVFDCIINLSSYSSRVVTSIYCWNSDPAQRCAVFAVCGVTVQNASHTPVAKAATSVTTVSFQANWRQANDSTSDAHQPTSWVLDVSTDPSFGSFVGSYNNYSVPGGMVYGCPVTGLTMGTTYYYRVRGVNSFGVSANSNVITVTLPSCANPTYPGAIAADQTNCGSFTPAAFTSTAAPTGYTGNLEYKWQYSVSPFSTWTDISSSNSSTYAPGLLTVTTKYRRLARVDCMSDWTGAAASDTLTVTINTIPQQFNVTGGGSYCAEGTGVAVGLSGSTSGISYALYNGASLVTTMTGTGSSLNFGLQTAAGTYTVVATDISTSCTNNMSGSATVIILPLPTPVISGPDVVTQGETVNYSTPDVPGHQYIWNIYLGTPVLCGGGCVNVTWAHICNIIEQGKVTVIETNLATGCTKTVYKMITIN